MPRFAPAETPAAELAGRKGLIISGGPASVYEPGSPTVDPGIFSLGTGSAGHLLRPAADGASCSAARSARATKASTDSRCSISDSAVRCSFEGLGARQQIWMSHRDHRREAARRLPRARHAPRPAGGRHRGRGAAAVRRAVPSGSGPHAQRHARSSRTSSSTSAGARRIGTRGTAFHAGRAKSAKSSATQRVLLRQRRRRFDRRLHALSAGARRGPRSRRLCRYRPDARGRDRVRADRRLARPAPDRWRSSARTEFLTRSKASPSPSEKRHIIGEKFVAVQERILESGRYLDGQLDSRSGNHLSGHHRDPAEPRKRGPHQDAPQPRRRHSEV